MCKFMESNECTVRCQADSKSKFLRVHETNKDFSKLSVWQPKHATGEFLVHETQNVLEKMKLSRIVIFLHFIFGGFIYVFTAHVNQIVLYLYLYLRYVYLCGEGE